MQLVVSELFCGLRRETALSPHPSDDGEAEIRAQRVLDEFRVALAASRRGDSGGTEHLVVDR